MSIVFKSASLRPEIQQGFERLKTHHTISKELGKDGLSRIIPILTICLCGEDYIKPISKSNIRELLRDKSSISQQLSRTARIVNKYVIPLLNALDKKPKLTKSPDGKYYSHKKGDEYAYIPDLLKDWVKLIKGLEKKDFNYSLLWDARFNFEVHACVGLLSIHFTEVFGRPKYALIRDILNCVFYDDEHWDTENIRQIAYRTKKLYASRESRGS